MTKPAHATGHAPSPFSSFVGVVSEGAGDGEARVAVELRHELLNNHAAGHGGVLLTLMDQAMAQAALSRQPQAHGVVTVDVNAAFMRPAHGHVVAVGRVVGGGRSVCFCEARITNAEGEVAASAMGTFRYLDPTPSATPHQDPP